MSSALNTTTVRNAFSTRRGSYSAYADAKGIVRVWDSVAGHYTVCHSLTPTQEARVRKMAANPQE